jgi:hypothetical protein
VRTPTTIDHRVYQHSLIGSVAVTVSVACLFVDIAVGDEVVAADAVVVFVRL